MDTSQAARQRLRTALQRTRLGASPGATPRTDGGGGESPMVGRYEGGFEGWISGAFESHLDLYVE